MITLTAKIDILPADDDFLSIGGSQSGLQHNAISAIIRNVVGKKTSYDNPFLLGVSNLGRNDRFTNEKTKKEYFLGMEISNQDGIFDTPITFVLFDKSEQMTSLTIAFDTQNNRHPTKINIDGVDYFDDDAIFTVGNLTPKSSHSIIITDWNTPNYPIVITGIYSNVSIDINSRNLISLETSLYDRSDLNLPSFGIISNNGNIEFNDYSGEVRDYAEQFLLQKGLKCEIKLHNTLVENAEKTVAVFETDKWNYNNEKQTASVSLKDDLEEWQNINVEEISYDARNPIERPLRYFYDHLHSITVKNGNYKMQSFNELDEITKSILENIIIKYPLLYSASLWANWYKVCQVGQLHIYKESDIVKCRYNGGN